MALDVRLTRDTNERWGFELLGGADDEMPLTIQKLQPSSPAARAGLQAGDTILMLNNEEALDWTHEEASRKIAECGDTLNMAVMRGLYDPVLDDQEPIYYEPGDLDPDSQPTEVQPFKIQQFLEPADLGSTPIDYGNTNDPLGTPFDPSVLLPEARSLTASPYVNPTKPYRPFSTEPVPEVPPLEDPIILNPNYKDQFGESPADINPDYILNAHYKNENLDGRSDKYKLPISEQYDPDGTKKIKNAEIESILTKYTNMEMLSKKSVTTTEKVTKTCKKDVKTTEKSTKDVKVDKAVTKDSKSSVVKEAVSKESVTKDVKESLKVKQEASMKKEVKTTEQYERASEDTEERMINEELKYIEEMKQEIDIAQIEETAVSVVDDSIERAVSVTEEIKKEMEEELSSEMKEESETRVTESSKYDKETKESAESKRIVKEIDSEIVDRRMSKEEYVEDIQQKAVTKDIKSEESRKVSKDDRKEAIESESYISEQYEEKVVKEMPRRKESYAQEASYTEDSVENKGEYKKVTKTVTTGSKTGAQQRTYALGLQTIPNIRGVVHSSYHYDLLLRTFFIHLTDVMVALSRFVLTQPIFNTESVESHETVTETKIDRSAKDIRKSEHDERIETVKKVEKQKVDDSKKVEVKQQKIVEEKKEVIKPAVVQEKKQEVKVVSQKAEKDVKLQEKKIERRQLVTPVPQEMKIESHEKVQKAELKQEQKKQAALAVTKVEEKKAITGAQMAQRTEKKLTKEMAQKMDAVISEFQTVAVEEDKKEMFIRSRRSRSRSQIEEEVARESDPLEWLAKVDSRRASQEISEERLSKTEFSSSETFEKKHFEKMERQEFKQKKTRTPKQMYRAIVEAHVYTNKDVIFEDASEFSETSSVQSAEEINTAFESFETVTSENVALESALQQLEQAQIVEESHELLKAHALSEATVQKLEEAVHVSSSIKQDEFKKETALQSRDVQEVVIQETREIVEPVVEIKEMVRKESISVDMNQSLAIAESREVNILESKSDFTSVDSKKESLKEIQSMDIQKVAIQETKEVIEPIVEFEETIKKQSIAMDISESLAVAESREVNIHESKSEFSNVESKKEALAKIKTSDIQEVVISETKEIIEPIVEFEETFKKQSVAMDISESLAVAESSEVSIHESKSEFSSKASKKESLAKIKTTDMQEVAVAETKEIIEPVVEIKETIKKESVAVANINESLSIAESSEINILESKNEFTSVESKKQSLAAMQSTEIQEVAIKETTEIIEPIVEIKETIKKESVALANINESLSIAESSEISILESKSEFTSVESKKQSLSAIQSTDIQEVAIKETKEIIEPVVEIKETIKKESLAVSNINESLSIAESTEVNILESKNEFTSIESKEESVAIIEEEDYHESAVVQAEIKSQVQIEDVTEKVKVKPYKIEEEYAALNIVKEVETEIETPNTEVVEVEEVVVKKIDISKELNLDLSKVGEAQSQEAVITTAEVCLTPPDFSKKMDFSSVSGHAQYKSESYTSQEMVQESSFTARSVDKSAAGLQRQWSVQSPSSSIDTPSPSTIPPTPVIDNYVFKFTVPLPREVTPVPRDCSLSPTEEDPQIVKKKLIPHIETAIEDKIIYDPPLASPPGDKVQSPIFKTPGLFGGASKPIYKIKFPPVYRKPGLFGGADNPEYSKEEIREIERKSSLLASAIDETIKSIEEYKEEVGMENKKDVKVSEFKEEKVSKSYSKKVVIETKQNGETTVIEEVIKNGDVGDDTKDSTVTIVEVVKEATKDKNADSQVKQEVRVKESSNVEVAKKDETKRGRPKIEVMRQESIEREKKEVANKIETEKKEVDIKEEVEIETKTVMKEEDTVETEKKEITKEEIKEMKKEEVTEMKKEEITEMKKEEITEMKKEESETIVKDSVESKTETEIQVQAESKSENEVTMDRVETKQTSEIPQTIPVTEETENKESETKTEVTEDKKVSETTIATETKVSEDKEEKKDPMLGFRPVVFDPAAVPKRETPSVIIELPTPQEGRQSPYITETGEIMGTIQGIVDGLEEPVIDPEIAKELGKPGISEEKIAELISGEAEMLREAHVMGLSRVLNSHMHRADDSVDFQKIKPMIDSLKDSEVLKALNEELARQKEEERKKEEKKWTTFLQKPKRPVPKAKFGYHGWTENEQALVLEPYKVKIVKQAKPKVAPDYKPEDFDTGPLPWEQRVDFEASLPPVEPEEPILIPEVPEYLEAVDPTKESEVPDLEDTGLPLPPPREPTPPPVIEQLIEEQPLPAEEPEVQEAPVIEEEKQREVDMDNRLAEQLVRSVQSMVDPNASVEQQLAQMRAQLAALAQLPEVIQQSLELVSKQLHKMSHQEAHVSMSASHQESHSYQSVEVTQNQTGQEGMVTEQPEPIQNHANQDPNKVTITEVEDKTEMAEQENVRDVRQERRLETPVMMQEMRPQTPQMTEEEMRMDKMKKIEHWNQIWPWGDTKSYCRKYRINFMKYEKPPVSLDHLQHSETYKLVHDMDQPPLKRVELRTPVIAEADYRERCRSMTPSGDKKHLQIPQQFHP